MITLLAFILMLSLMTFVHELGHFLSAKATGITVEEFGFGYPPRLLTLWRSPGTIIVGGKKLLIPRRLHLPKDLRSGAMVLYVSEKDTRGREVLKDIEVVDPKDPKAVGAKRVERLERGTIYSINAIPFGGFVRMLGEEDPTEPGSFASRPKRARVLTLIAGPAMNLLLAVFVFAGAYMAGWPKPTYQISVILVEPGSPAEAAGLQAGDIILRANDFDLTSNYRLADYTRAHLGQEIILTVQRGEEILHIPVVPRTQWPSGQGPIGIQLGISVTSTSLVYYGPLQALWRGLKQAGQVISFTFHLPVLLMRGQITPEQARPVGPLGIAQMTGNALQQSLNTRWWFPILQMTGILNAALALTNLLPLPALDGGRLLFVVIEAIRGKRVDPKKEGFVHLIGMAALIGLMLIITYQDIVSPVPTFDWSSLLTPR